MDTRINQLVVFKLDMQCFALHLAAVERTVFVVEITPLPKAPTIVLGVINVQGQIIPVVNIRERFCLPTRQIELSDRLVIARTARGLLALLVDTVVEVIERPQADITASDAILSGIEYIAGVIKFDDGLIFIHDLDTFLSPAEELSLQQAIARS